MKKFLSYLCIVAMLLTIVQIPAFAEEGEVTAISVSESVSKINGYTIDEDFGYTRGDELVIKGKLKKEYVGVGYNTEKLVLAVSAGSKDAHAATITKKAEAGAEVNWNVAAMEDEATTIRTWDEMKAAFSADNTVHYKIFKFAGDAFVSATDRSGNASTDQNLIHKNADAAAANDRATSTYSSNPRTVTMRNDVFNLNLGADWKNLFLTSQDEIGTVKGQAFSKDLYAIYVGSGTYYYNIVVLDDSWISEASVITEIAASEPTNASYIVGERFDKNTVTVTATYGDGSTQVITDYEVSPAEFAEKGEKEVTISYKGFETKVNVTVAGIKGISATAPTKLYKIGDTFDKTDIQVTAIYENDRTVPVTEFTVAPDVFTASGGHLPAASFFAA